MKDSAFLVAPGNDYRGLAELSDRGQLTATVVIPVYNRTALLKNVLIGLTLQESESTFNVVVVDDGSDEDVAGVAAAFNRHLDIRIIRQERSGRGAGRARNLGAAESVADVLLFLDADCVPGPAYVEAHMRHHRKAANVVVSASRRHIDRPIFAEDVENFETLLIETLAGDDDRTEAITPDDWRRVFYRRSQSLLLGDSAFRVVLSGLMSVSRSMFHEVGGFDEAFTQWGGEDTEIGWRLWNNGCFIVPENAIAVIHQRSEDLETPEGRTSSRQSVLRLVADRVPHRFYRREPSHLYSVPKTSVIVMVSDGEAVDRAWQETTRATTSDTELIVVGSEDSVAQWESAAHSGDFSVSHGFRAALERARGELVALVDGRSRFDRRLLERVVRRFDDPKTGAVRVGYRAGSSRAIRLADLQAVDAQFGTAGLPFFAVMKRRELMKDRDALDVPGAAVAGALARSSVNLLVTDLVEVPTIRTPTGRTPGLAELRSAGATEIARGVRRSFRRQASRSQETGPEGGDLDARVPMAYVGLPGHDNLGDDAMLAAVRGLMPWARIESGCPDAQIVMLGGGTLFNAGGYYLNRIRQVDGPNLERVVFGTGMRSIEFWGTTERSEDWTPFLSSALSVGVRGPLTQRGMQEWGIDRAVDIIGDPALGLEPRTAVPAVEGRVVLSPLHTEGKCWGGDDDAVLEAYARLARTLRSDGHDLMMLTAHPSDDRWAIEVMRDAGIPDMNFIAGYANLDRALDVISSSDLVVGERLHSVVLAAAMGTPFVAVEYRPKVRDFAASIDAEAWCVRTDDVGGLRAIVTDRLASKADHQRNVDVLRARLAGHANRLAQSLAAANG